MVYYVPYKLLCAALAGGGFDGLDGLDLGAMDADLEGAETKDLLRILMPLLNKLRL